MPIDKRTMSSLTPALVSSAGFNWRCVVKAGRQAALEAAKVPCGAINNLAEVFADPQIEARHMATHWQHPVKHDLRLVSSPIKLSNMPVRCDLPPPLGQHTEDVLRGMLNYSDEKLSEPGRSEVI